MIDFTSKVYIGELILRSSEKMYIAKYCFCFFPLHKHYLKIKDSLHPIEQEYYKKLEFEGRKKSFLIGRYAAKKAVAALDNENNLVNIIIQQGVFEQPIVKCASSQNTQVSITHSNNLGAAIAFPEDHPMGIDVEQVNDEKKEAFEYQLTNSELKLLSTLPFSYVIDLTLLWTAKESLSKVIKTGLTTPFQVFKIYKFEIKNDLAIFYYKNFPQYKTISFLISDYICSITYPIKTEIDINIEGLRHNLFESNVFLEDKKC